MRETRLKPFAAVRSWPTAAIEQRRENARNRCKAAVHGAGSWRRCKALLDSLLVRFVV
jgi:hypothetical protein